MAQLIADSTRPIGGTDQARLELWERGVPVVSLAEKWNVEKATIYRAYGRALARREKSSA